MNIGLFFIMGNGWLVTVYNLRIIIVVDSVHSINHSFYFKTFHTLCC